MNHDRDQDDLWYTLANLIKKMYISQNMRRCEENNSRRPNECSYFHKQNIDTLFSFMAYQEITE